MTVKVFDDILTAEEIKILLDYLNLDDERADVRHDFRSKHPRWNQDTWPQDIIEKVLSKTIGDDYSIFETEFMQQQIPLKMHVDAEATSWDDLHMAVMICLGSEPEGQTIYFENYWKGTQENSRNAHFTRQPWSPFVQKFRGRDGNWIEVTDIRDLLAQCETAPESVTDIEVTAEFVEYLRDLVKKRSTRHQQPEINHFALPEPRYSDYDNQLTNYDDTREFPHDVWEQYLQHQPYSDFHGLALDKIVEHRPGRIAVWPRSQVHCSSHRHSLKSNITVFTKKAGR